MKVVALAADHNGVKHKASVKQLLKEMGFHTVDLGPYSDAVSVDYTDYAFQLGQIVSCGDADLGILICGTGIGMSIAVNRFDHVRAALAHNLLSAHKSREHNDSNVLCLGSWLNSEEGNLEIVRTWINEKFGEKRHVKRVEKLVLQRENTVVFTNGIFDILHSGHIELLKFSKSLGYKLVVGINSDRITRALKGDGRPVNKEYDRKSVLESVQYVDEVIVFDEEKPTALVESLQPDIVVKGGEWTADEVRERDSVPEHIQVKIYPFKQGYSTTGVIQTIKAREGIETKKEEPACSAS